MEEKFTLRDFLVYFITGLYLLLILLWIYDLKLLQCFNISKADIKDNQAITIFLLLPGLYLLGHFIHGLDLAIYKIGRLIWDKKIKKETTEKKISCFHKFLIFTLNGNRVTGHLNEKNIKSNEFWKKVSKLQLMDKFGKAEYWHLMNDLFKGLSLISFISIILNIIDFHLLNIVISVALFVVFWYRARHMVVNFVSTTCNTADLTNNNKVD